MDATVAERGQITLPKRVRDALGLTKGTVLKVELRGDVSSCVRVWMMQLRVPAADLS